MGGGGDGNQDLMSLKKQLAEKERAIKKIGEKINKETKEVTDKYIQHLDTISRTKEMSQHKDSEKPKPSSTESTDTSSQSPADKVKHLAGEMAKLKEDLVNVKLREPTSRSGRRRKHKSIVKL